MARKTDEDIDEDFIISSMNMRDFSAKNKEVPTNKVYRENTPEVQEKPLQGIAGKDEKENKKRKSKGDFESLFIRQADIAGRQEKTIYIREKYYDRIDKIIKLYNNPRLSVFSYVDAVLELHFETYKQDIKEIHDKLYTAPYE